MTIIDTIKRGFRNLFRKPSNLETYAEEELRRGGYFDKDGAYGGMLGHAVMKMVREFAQEGHSGMSAGITLAVFKKVAAFQPLTPLTGGADEWNEVGEGVFQNRRCSHVFMEDGQAYDSQGIIFKDADGMRYTNRNSRVPVTFPYTPASAISKVAA